MLGYVKTIWHVESVSDIEKGHEDMQTISVNGRSLAIRANLHDFLSCYRELEPYSPLLWIDQICIDQSQVQERNHQVGLMDQIYQKAEKTIVWVGNDPHDGLAFGTLQRLSDEGRRILGPSAEGYTLSERLREEINADVIAVSEPERQAIKELRSSSYWTRHWIVQELMLSSDRQIMHGASRMSWFDFVIGDTALRQSKHGPDDRKRYDHIAKLISLSNLAIPSARLIAADTLRAQCFRVAATTSCHDVRDKIYGIQSLFPPSMRIDVDYDATPKEVLLSAAMALAKSLDRRDLSRINFDFDRIACAMGFEAEREKLYKEFTSTWQKYCKKHGMDKENNRLPDRPRWDAPWGS